jgi:hypothetical protein
MRKEYVDALKELVNEKEEMVIKLKEKLNSLSDEYFRLSILFVLAPVEMYDDEGNLLTYFEYQRTLKCRLSARMDDVAKKQDEIEAVIIDNVNAILAMRKEICEVK